MSRRLSTIVLLAALSLALVGMGWASTRIRSETMTVHYRTDLTLLIDGRPVSLDVTPFFVDPGWIMVPVEFVARELGASVTWDDASSTLSITRKPVAAVPDPDPSSQGLADTIDRLLPANVVIVTSDGSQGSGFVAGSDGAIITAYHVIEDAAWATVSFSDGRVFDVVGLLGSSPQTDLAVLRIDAPGLPRIELGDSDLVRVGDRALALGNPLGLVGTVSEGMISGIRDLDLGTSVIPGVFQITSAVSPGSSGGALVNDEGKAIGVICATREGGQLINFAVPINLVRPLLGGSAVSPLPAAGLPGQGVSPAETGGVTVGRFLEVADALTSRYNELLSEADRYVGSPAASRAAFSRYVVQELEPLLDELIGSTPPGEMARLHNVDVKFQTSMLVTYELWARGYQAYSLGDRVLGDALIDGGNALLEIAEPWRVESNALSQTLPGRAEPGTGGSTVSEYVVRANDWIDAWHSADDVAAGMKGAGAAEWAAFNSGLAVVLEPLMDPVIASAPPGDYGELHRLTVKFQMGVLLTHTVSALSWDRGDTGLALAADEIMSIADYWRVAGNRLIEELWGR